ncbi:hypothetical protein C8R43DRAFT_1052756 [Mycena crocata]|nr:hypothetical protein C8R43DRAFT_1052756 [Mycena crocata]
MSTTTRSRKRRRSQAFTEPEDVKEAVSDDEEPPKYVESTGQDRLDKERDVWDAFKDEHVEVFDLSSSLWRRFDLVRELEQQDAQTTASLLSWFMKYVDLRRAISQPPLVDGPDTESETPGNLEPHTDDSPAEEGSTATTSNQPIPAPNGASFLSHAKAAPPDAPSHTSREILAMIAKFSEASIRDREEKVNVTRTASDSVERSIRIIDQAIQEQEHAISLGARSGTRLAPILLPEIVLPRWGKPARVTLSPDLDDILGVEQKPPAPRRKKNRKGRKKDVLPAEATVPPPRPKPPVIPNADPNESRYCYCDQVSFGEMIGCDNPHCKREWFHLSCTNLEAAPEGRKKWYCDDCTAQRTRKRIR